MTNLCLDTSAFDRSVDGRTAHAILDRFHAAGGNFLQVDADGPVRTEAVAGTWLRDGAVDRDDLVIAARLQVPSRSRLHGSLSQHVRASCEDVLGGLGTEHIDLLLCSMPDLRLAMAELMDAWAELIADGHVHHVGVCGFHGWRVRDAFACAAHGLSPRVVAVQADHGVGRAEPFERNIARVCRDADAAFLLRADPRLWENPPAHRGPVINRDASGALEWIAAQRGESKPQTELAWILGDSDVTSVVVRAGSLDDLTTLCQAAAHPLSPDEHRRVAASWSRSGDGPAAIAADHMELEHSIHGGPRDD